MYYEEKIINGILCWRSDPLDCFTPYTIEQISEMYMEAKRASGHYSMLINNAIDALNGREC